jgi:ubiquitin C-terminal hydrolase
MSEKDKKGIVGLTNIGNTCYGNATIQAIRHQVDFTIFLLQGTHKKLLNKKAVTEKTRLLESYIGLVRKLWTGEGGEESTKEFWGNMIPAAIHSGVDHFRFPVAHDAHEFLVFLLDTFHEALSDDVTMVVRTDQTKKMTRQALEYWKKSFEHSYSPLVELIFSLQRKSICCQTCQKESVSWETMNMFKVSVPKPTGPEPLELLDLMKTDSNEETIDDYHCESCPERTKAILSHSIWRLGNWMIIVLKRIENNGKRINTPVNIPLTLSFNSLFHKSSTEPSSTQSYELFSTINHHGSAQGGHYTSQAKHPVTGCWAFYDDENTRHIEKPILDPSTYILMYRAMR